MAGTQDRPTDHHPDYGNPPTGTLVSSSPSPPPPKLTVPYRQVLGSVKGFVGEGLGFFGLRAFRHGVGIPGQG